MQGNDVPPPDGPARNSGRDKLFLHRPPGTPRFDPNQPLTVLLVEDSLADAGLIREHLRSSIQSGELVLRLARTLKEAVAEVSRQAYSCVLLDLGLPDGRGIGNVQALRTADRNAALVVLTGLDDDRTAIEALDQGAQDYVIKGEYSTTRLLAILRHAVQRNRQVLELEAQRNQGFYQASHDPLTGLANRQLFSDRARQLLETVRRHRQSCSLLLLDLDGFKPINDQFGHIVGDDLLVRFSRILSESVRGSDTVARLGGDEFVILAGPGVPDEAERIAERTLQRTASLRDVAGEPIRLGCSIGIAISPRHGDTLPALLRKSDRAMYTAKQRGGHQAVVFEPPMEDPTHSRVLPLRKRQA